VTALVAPARMWQRSLPLPWPSTVARQSTSLSLPVRRRVSYFGTFQTLGRALLVCQARPPLQPGLRACRRLRLSVTGGASVDNELQQRSDCPDVAPPPTHARRARSAGLTPWPASVRLVCDPGMQQHRTHRTLLVKSLVNLWVGDGQIFALDASQTKSAAPAVARPKIAPCSNLDIAFELTMSSVRRDRRRDSRDGPQSRASGPHSGTRHERTRVFSTGPTMLRRRAHRSRPNISCDATPSRL